MVVDCMLPGQVRTLGQRNVYLSARRAARLTARDCQIRGGEYVAYDRADLRSALTAWLPAAESGDLEAQVIVGEIYERGLGVQPDFAEAARWYRAAADRGSRRAQVNLGALYEQGLGVAADPQTALQWYRRAAGPEAALEIDPARLSQPVVRDDAARDAQIGQLRAQARQLEEQLQRLQADVAERTMQVEILQRERTEQQAALEQQIQAAQGSTRAAEAARAASDAEQRRLAETSSQLSQREAELAAQRIESARLAQELAAVSQLATDRQAELERLQQVSQQRLLAGPEIALVEPALVATRDIVPVAMARGPVRRLVGRATAPAGIAAVSVNDANVSSNELGVFTTDVAVTGSDVPVSIVAVDRQGKRAEMRFILRAEASSTVPVASSPSPDRVSAAVDFGTYHALLIGNNDYQFLPDLASPVNDVTDLARQLEKHYGFRTTVLINANRYQILAALNSLRETLTSRDNLLIYYAGHGELDEVNQRGHWLPTDAEPGSTANWIPATAITDLLNIMQARQILLVADSCYAGALTRSSSAKLRTGMTDAERLHWYRAMTAKRSRTVLTSGGLAPVLDAGGGRYSVFAKALLEVLEANGEVLDGARLHREVAARVAYAAASLRFDQVPEYAPIRFAGHETGEFFLVPRR